MKCNDSLNLRFLFCMLSEGDGKEQRMMKRLILVIINFLVSGFMAFTTTMFFAGGTIADNDTDKIFVAPGFFAVFIIWGIGAILAFIYPFKPAKKRLYTSLIFMWGALPGGFVIGGILSL